MIPGEDCKLIKPSDQIPPRSDVAGYEDRKGEYGERVHECLSLAHHRVENVRRVGE